MCGWGVGTIGHRLKGPCLRRSSRKGSSHLARLCLTHWDSGSRALGSHSMNLPVVEFFISCRPNSFSSRFQHDVQHVPSHLYPSSPFLIQPVFIPSEQWFLQSSVISSKRQLQGRSALYSPLGPLFRFHSRGSPRSS